MELEQWIRTLAAKIDPPNRDPARTVAYLQPRLEDLSPFWFTTEAIDGLFLKLRTLNSAERVRAALRDFHAEHATRAPRPAPAPEPAGDPWDSIQDRYSRDWDDPAGIVRKVGECDGNIVLLRLLVALVLKWAPQHEQFLPPLVVEAVRRQPANGQSRSERLAALAAQQRQLRPAYLSPAELDRLNPLPDGAKRYDGPDPAADPAFPAAAPDDAAAA